MSRTRAAASPRLADWAMLMALVALWGSAFLLIDLALQGFRPLSISTGRLIIGAGVLFLMVAFSSRRLPTSGRVWGLFVLMAILGNALPFFLVSWGQQGIPSGLAGILMAVMPLVVLALAHFLVPGEALTGRRLAGFGLGFAGIVFLLGPRMDSAGEGGGGLLYQLAVLGAAVCYGLNVIVARRAPSLDPVVVSACVLLLAATISSAIWLIAPTDAAVGPQPEAAAGPWLAMAALGALCTGLATVIYYRVVHAAGATFLSLINYLIPVWAVLVGALFLGERLPLPAFVGLVLILSGIVLSQSRSARTKP
jgi:drug/metabolite transporter (DMT)-like permease